MTEPNALLLTRSQHASPGQVGVEVRAPDPDSARTDTDRWQLAPVDPVPDRLLVDLEQIGDLLDGQEFVAGGWLHQSEPN